ncbi:short chain dehydrogenase [Ceratobasidium sp. AG-Ba]|nr:short chain dehydrogenase [Ceratobasidium sp. AG-Ba]
MSTQPWKTALVTGGAAGLGKATAQSLIKRGKSVYLADRNESALSATAKEIGAAGYFALDLTDISSLSAFAEKVQKDAPEIDCLINNAGIQVPLDFVKGADLDAATQEINTNITGLVHLCGLFTPHLVQKDAACIMNVGSALGYVPASFAPVYSASMAFSKSFTVSLRQQLKSTNVTVIEISPPLVESNLHEHQDSGFSGFVSSNHIKALSQNEWISVIEKGWDEGAKEIGAGFSQVCITKWRETFGPIHAKLASSS